MKELAKKLEGISKKAKLIALIAIILCIVFEAVFVFPIHHEITLPKTESMFNFIYRFIFSHFSLIFCYLVLGFGLYSLATKNLLLFLAMITGCNMIGLGLRIWLEWGEYTLVQYLNTRNILFTYIPIISITFIGYMYNRFIQKNCK